MSAGVIAAHYVADAGTPTRFYLEASGTAGASPAFDAEWANTAIAQRHPTSPTKAGTALGNYAGNSSTTSTPDCNVLHKQFVSDPLNGAQTISGTVKGIIRGAESNLDADMRTQLIIKVVSGDGLTVRGTLLAADNSGPGSNPASEFTTTHTTRKIPWAWTGSGIALSSVSALNGDRLVFEVGIRIHGTATTRWATMLFGSSAATDFAEDETQTTTLNPWVELSQGIAF